MRLLIVEDEQKTAALIRNALVQEQFEVTCVSDGEAGLVEGVKGHYDIMIVDIMLPRLDGLSLVRVLRDNGHKVPVIILSARGDVEERVQGLNAGADDYLPKPFAMSELLARIRSLTRRATQLNPGTLSVADLTFDLSTRDVRRDGKRIDLSPRESRLLECLLRADGRVVSRRDIIRQVWEYDFDTGTNLVDVYVRRLRDKIDRDRSLALIQTVRGLGYVLRLQS